MISSESMQKYHEAENIVKPAVWATTADRLTDSYPPSSPKNRLALDTPTTNAMRGKDRRVAKELGLPDLSILLRFLLKLNINHRQTTKSRSTVPYKTVITCQEAIQHLGQPDWVFVDCRANMADRDLGFRIFCAAHLPHAVYAGLDDDLSGPVIPGSTGRHPLPNKEDLIALIGRLGISNSTQVVVYDEQAGQMAAARLWWLLNWAGHEPAAVLDGGMTRWRTLGYPVASDVHRNQPAAFKANFLDRLLCHADDVTGVLHDPATVLVDSRAADRYRGENEIIDPVAGHIPGAVNAPFGDTIENDGSLKPPPNLKTQFCQRGIFSVRHPIFYCGSGVTAALNILAYAHAGLGMPRLYAGSWSDWITDRTRPVAVGDESA